MPTTPADQQYTPPSRRKFYITFVVLFCCVLAVTAVGGFKAYDMAERQYMERQGLTQGKDVADAVKTVELWRESVDRQVKRVSSSELYRLFATEVNQLDPKIMGLINESDTVPLSGGDVTAVTEQIPLMRNVLLDFISYNGFTGASIVNDSGQMLLSAHTRPQAITPPQKDAVHRAIQEGRLVFAPATEGAGSLMVDVADPMQAVLSGENKEKPVAALLLSLPVSGQINSFVGAENRLERKATLSILQYTGKSWQQLRSNGIVQLSASVQETLQPESSGLLPFIERPSLSGDGKSYLTGRLVEGMDWWVVSELPASVVQGALRDKAMEIGVIGFCICMGFLLLFPLLWWMMIGRTQQANAMRFQALYHTIRQQKQFLDSINLSLNVGLFMMDEGGEIKLCNRSFAAILNSSEEALAGKGLFLLFAPESSEKLLAAASNVLKNNVSVTCEVEHVLQGEQFLYRVTLFPFTDSAEPQSRGVVGTMQDITSFRKRSLQQQRQQRNTMRAFTKAIEGVDPHLAGHSRMMKILGVLTARQMRLDESDMRTVSLGAELSQVGKIFLPQEILRKTGKLTPAEQAEVKRVPEYAYSVLRDIDFDLPVADAVYSLNENMDGSGYPRGLQGTAISIHARVLAVVNAFCAMVSPRSYREGMTPGKALGMMRQMPGFDQQVVNALELALQTPEGATVLQQQGKVERDEKEN